MGGRALNAGSNSISGGGGGGGGGSAGSSRFRGRGMWAGSAASDWVARQMKACVGACVGACVCVCVCVWVGELGCTEVSEDIGTLLGGRQAEHLKVELVVLPAH